MEKNKLRILIVDDEAHARAALRGMIQKNFDQVEILAELDSLPDAVKAIHKFKPDLVLLDIEMPGHLGTEILDFFDPAQIDFQIAFVTAYNEYAIKAFELSAVDYILKPAKISELGRAFERAQNLRRQSQTERYAVLKEQLDESKPLSTRLAFQTAEGLCIYPASEVLYLRADSCYTHITLKDGQKITVSKTLQEYNGLEDLGHFLRINRSYIINTQGISLVSKKDGGFVLMQNGHEIPLSAEKRQALYSLFKDITF